MRGKDEKIGRFFIGVNIMALGVAMSKQSQLGTSPIAAIPNVLSESLEGSLGLLTIIFMVLLVILQLLIVGKNSSRSRRFKIVIQLVPGILFGLLINCYDSLLQRFQTTNHYGSQLTILLLSVLVLALGVYLEVSADFIVMPGEGLPQTISNAYHVPFAKVKVWTDVTMVILALLFSFSLGHPFSGIREGTLIATLLTGPCVSLFDSFFKT
ncbi:integral membrane protein [Streptococcus pseudoporcinus]|uniref:Integral membrane protein n=1 Tax=Streptococcus pseudoporcinus TaxID=361101 RepID=A0A4U9XKQ0_9STRE|nr:DUF6198 family protein [Streptococcus pseudoporcinus]VTS13412.1 integral membrane protein [Streptococcus pseudoporcinus]